MVTSGYATTENAFYCLNIVPYARHFIAVKFFPKYHFTGMQGWRSGESVCLPPLCPGFDSRTRRHVWVEFVVGSQPCSEGFFWFSSVHKNQHSKFQSNMEMRVTDLSALLLVSPALNKVNLFNLFFYASYQKTLISEE